MLHIIIIIIKTKKVLFLKKFFMLILQMPTISYVIYLYLCVTCYKYIKIITFMCNMLKTIYKNYYS